MGKKIFVPSYRRRDGTKVRAYNRRDPRFKRRRYIGPTADKLAKRALHTTVKSSVKSLLDSGEYDIKTSFGRAALKEATTDLVFAESGIPPSISGPLVEMAIDLFSKENKRL